MAEAKIKEDVEMQDAEQEDKKSKLKKEITDNFKDKKLEEIAYKLPKPLPENISQDEIRALGYYYTAEGKLLDVEKNEPFSWNGQEHYDKLGEAIERYIQKVMVSEYNFKEVMLPRDVDIPENTPTPKTNIFISNDCFSKETICLIIQGSGTVRAGQWARSVCINDCLGGGSCIPYFSECASRDWGMLVLNPNDNKREVEGEDSPVDILHNENRRKHVKYVYEKFLSSGSQPITIIAHSAGGMAVVALLLSEFSEELENRVRGIAFTDSVHDMHAECPDWIEDKEAFSRAHNIITTRAINWIGSDNPLDTPLNPRQQTRCVSAGHEKHVYTSPSAFPSVFPFLDGMLKGEGLPAWSELRIEADENESKEEAENGDANKRALEPAVDQSNPQENDSEENPAKKRKK